MSKALAFRLRKVLPNIIHHNQSSCVEGRYIGETISTIYDIVAFTKRESTSGIVSVPFVEWNFIYRCMKVFVSDLTLQDDFQYFTKLVSSCICNNGVLSDYLILERPGVRQGGYCNRATDCNLVLQPCLQYQRRLSKILTRLFYRGVKIEL